jgi:hypothetical protein
LLIMRSFLIHYGDFIVETALGLWLTVYAMRNRERLRASAYPPANWRYLPALGPFLIVLAVLRLFLNAEPSPQWHREFTNDQRASAEFPYSTTAGPSVKSAGGNSILVFEVECVVPNRNIQLRLSLTEEQLGSRKATMAERIENLKKLGEAQGVVFTSISNEEFGLIHGIRVTTENRQQKIRAQARYAFAAAGVYSAMGISSFAESDDPMISRVLDSFTMK